MSVYRWLAQAVDRHAHHQWTFLSLLVTHPTCHGRLVSLGAHLESDSVLGTKLLVYDGLVDLKLVPVLVKCVHVTIKRLDDFELPGVG